MMNKINTFSIVLGLVLLSNSYTVRSLADDRDENSKDHDSDTPTAGTAAKDAEAAKPKADEAGKSKLTQADDKKADDRKLAAERIRIDVTSLNDTALLKLWNEVTKVEKVDLEKFKTIVKELPSLDPDKKKDEEKRTSLIKVFEKSAELLSESPLKEFQKVSSETVFERFQKKKEDGVVQNDGGKAADKANTDKANADKLKAATDELAKLNAKKGEADKKLEDLAKGIDPAKLAEAQKADQNKQLSDALKSALGQAGQGNEGGGAGAGSGAGDSGSGSGKGSGSGDSGSESKKDLPKASDNKKDKNRNANNSSTNTPSTSDSSNGALKKEENKEKKSIIPESKVAEKKTPTPSEVTPVKTPEVAEAGTAPRPGGQGSSRKPGSLGQATAGQVINAGNLPSSQPGNEIQPPPNGGPVANTGSSNSNNSSGADPSYLKPYSPPQVVSPPTSTGYNMIKVGPNDWQVSDGGAANETSANEGSYEGSDSNKKPVSMASSSPIGLPSASGFSGSSRGATSNASAIAPQGVFKKQLEWQGGGTSEVAGICRGTVKNLIGVCAARKT